MEVRFYNLNLDLLYHRTQDFRMYYYYDHGFTIDNLIWFLLIDIPYFIYLNFVSFKENTCSSVFSFSYSWLPNYL